MLGELLYLIRQDLVDVWENIRDLFQDDDEN